MTHVQKRHPDQVDMVTNNIRQEIGDWSLSFSCGSLQQVDFFSLFFSIFFFQCCISCRRAMYERYKIGILYAFPSSWVLAICCFFLYDLVFDFIRLCMILEFLKASADKIEMRDNLFYFFWFCNWCWLGFLVWNAENRQVAARFAWGWLDCLFERMELSGLAKFFDLSVLYGKGGFCMARRLLGRKIRQ